MPQGLMLQVDEDSPVRQGPVMLITLFLAQAAVDTSATERYVTCVTDKAVAYSQLDERAETIATAAKAACGTDRAKAEGSIPRDVARRQQIISNMEKAVTERAVHAVLETRLKRASD